MQNRVCKCGCGALINHRHGAAKFLNNRHRINYKTALMYRKQLPVGRSAYSSDDEDYDDTHIFDLSDSQ